MRTERQRAVDGPERVSPGDKRLASESFDDEHRFGRCRLGVLKETCRHQSRTKGLEVAGAGGIVLRPTSLFANWGPG
jgi:hypothetical protein